MTMQLGGQIPLGQTDSRCPLIVRNEFYYEFLRKFVLVWFSCFSDYVLGC